MYTEMDSIKDSLWERDIRQERPKSIYFSRKYE